MKGVPAPERCPRCAGTEFRSIRLARAVGMYGASSRPAQRCANTECGLRFDGNEWTRPDWTVFEMAESGT